ncbi:MAG: IclR family transcriptional regulator [Deltaproteobacteria bacterium]|nr:IclR family transcriptional regulator [Deltaproteobacteria bacterium]
MKILLAFTDENVELGTMEMTQLLGMNKATISRIVSSLLDYGFLSRNPQTRKFRLGSSIVRLGLAVNRSVKKNMVFVAKPFIDRLRDDIDETVVLNIRFGKDIIVSYIADNRRRLRVNIELGEISPPHAGASGKAIYAFMPKPFVEELFSRQLPRLTPNTMTDPEELKTQFEIIRERGYAFDKEEVEPGFNAVASPVFDFEGNPIAAVGVVGISPGISSWEDDHPIIPLLKEIAREISERLY